MSSENKILNVEKCMVVLVDIAGTTTSKAFLEENLFAFAKDNAQQFLKENWEDEEVKKAINLLKGDDKELDIDGAVEQFKKFTDEGSNNQGVKTLQGLIYKIGFADGKLKAHVYSDVPKAFEIWMVDHKIGVYSTGTIEAQKQLFAHSIEGDLSSHISYYFDQTIGNKTKSSSYKKIAEDIKVKPEEIFFITDSIDELKAAKEAGLQAALIEREKSSDESEEVAKEFSCITAFTDVCFENSNNKRKPEEEVTSQEEPPTKIAKTEPNKESLNCLEASPEKEEKAVENELNEKTDKSETVVKDASQIENKNEVPAAAEPMEVDVPDVEVNEVLPTNNPEVSNNDQQLKGKEEVNKETVIDEIDKSTNETPVTNKTENKTELVALKPDISINNAEEMKGNKVDDIEMKTLDNKIEEAIEVSNEKGTDKGLEKTVEVASKVTEISIEDKSDLGGSKPVLENCEKRESIQLEVVANSDTMKNEVENTSNNAEDKELVSAIKGMKKDTDKCINRDNSDIENKKLEDKEIVVSAIEEIKKDTDKCINRDNSDIENKKLEDKELLVSTIEEIKKDTDKCINRDNSDIENKKLVVPKIEEISKDNDTCVSFDKNDVNNKELVTKTEVIKKDDVKCMDIETKDTENKESSVKIEEIKKDSNKCIIVVDTNDTESKEPPVSKLEGISRDNDKCMKEDKIIDEQMVLKQNTVNEQTTVEENKEEPVKEQDTTSKICLGKENAETLSVESSSDKVDQLSNDKILSSEVDGSTNITKSSNEEILVSSSTEDSAVIEKNKNPNIKQDSNQETETEVTVSTSENVTDNGNGNVIAADIENGDISNGHKNIDEKNKETDSEEIDIKVKKLESNADSPTVAVEV